jgi:hypothetical protein
MARAAADCRAMPIARLRSVVLDCPQFKALAEFYRAVLGGEVTFVEDDWVVLTVDGLRLAFQLVEEFAAPTWPYGERPQQFHLDVTVDDVDAVPPLARHLHRVVVVPILLPAPAALRAHLSLSGFRLGPVMSSQSASQRDSHTSQPALARTRQQ